MPKLNLRSTAVKRIMQEAAELAAAHVDDDGFVAAPLEVRPDLSHAWPIDYPLFQGP